jgi:hypothetical protein
MSLILQSGAGPPERGNQPNAAVAGSSLLALIELVHWRALLRPSKLDDIFSTQSPSSNSTSLSGVLTILSSFSATPPSPSSRVLVLLKLTSRYNICCVLGKSKPWRQSLGTLRPFHFGTKAARQKDDCVWVTSSQLPLVSATSHRKLLGSAPRPRSLISLRPEEPTVGQRQD